MLLDLLIVPWSMPVNFLLRTPPVGDVTEPSAGDATLPVHLRTENYNKPKSAQMIKLHHIQNPNHQTEIKLLLKVRNWETKFSSFFKLVLYHMAKNQQQIKTDKAAEIDPNEPLITLFKICLHHN
jgi:hypothetical protein